MLPRDARHCWNEFLEFAKGRCSATAFGNWLAPIRILEASDQEIVLEIPNLFVKEYLLSNYGKDLSAFLPIRESGEVAIQFVVAKGDKEEKPKSSGTPERKNGGSSQEVKLNRNYRFSTFIEGPNNQFVKSAAIGVASRPGQTYNPYLFTAALGWVKPIFYTALAIT